LSNIDFPWPEIATLSLRHCGALRHTNRLLAASQGVEYRRNPMLQLIINGAPYDIDVDPATPLLWVIRDYAGLTGTKYGCGMALCGACTVHLDGAPIRSCVTPVSAAVGHEITTIEGINKGRDGLHPLQQAWIDEQIPQCGYCQSGQIMSAAALLERNSAPTDVDIDKAMSGNICRCGTYPRIRKGIKRAARAVNALADDSVSDG